MDPNCVFCKIIKGVSSSRKIYQDNLVTAFHDIHPAAPLHILIVPNKHIESVNSVSPEDEPVLGHLFTVVRQIAIQEKVDGYRLIINNGRSAGQSVFHLHLHMLGGKRMPIPMV